MKYVFFLLLVWAGNAVAAPVVFSTDERARIAAHGPWPPVMLVDAGNSADGNRDAIELGRRLFFDRRLSASGKMSCATCHSSKTAFQDGRQSVRDQRNTPTLLNAGGQRWFGWGGAHDSLWDASRSPLVAKDELAATPQTLYALLQRDVDVRRRYIAVFGAPAPGPLLVVNFSKALAAYQATLVSPRTSFDDFRDAMQRGDATAAAQYPEAAQRGLQIFVGAGRCFFCHGGPSFTNGEFADIGRKFFNARGADSGRWGGLQQLLASPYTRLGAFSDSRGDTAVATRHVLMEPRNFGEFKVPGLRNLKLTAPYFHDGSAARIEDVVIHYSTLDETRLHSDGERILRSLKLTPAEVKDLAAFLKTL